VERALKFKDHFSARAAQYAAFRPVYPDALIDHISALSPRRALALDCGTGSGQAAASLATRFDRVVATDRSSEQLRHAVAAPNLEYRGTAAEDSGLPDGSVDLVTAAQALHWFDIPAFFREARRVLAPDGVIAVWGYGDPILHEPALQTALHEFNRGLLEPYWPAERELLLAGYATIDFPFAEISVPRFELRERWTLAQLAGHLRSWSAVGRYEARHGRDPVIDLVKTLTKTWGAPDALHTISWPLRARTGRHSA